MSTAIQRSTLVSSGEHIGAIRRLPESYSASEYLVAVEAARAAGDGETYANAVVGADVTEDDGGATVRAAESLLRRQGVDPAKASYREYCAALVEVSV